MHGGIYIYKEFYDIYPAGRFLPYLLNEQKEKGCFLSSALLSGPEGPVLYHIIVYILHILCSTTNTYSSFTTVLLI